MSQRVHTFLVPSEVEPVRSVQGKAALGLPGNWWIVVLLAVFLVLLLVVAPRFLPSG